MKFFEQRRNTVLDLATEDAYGLWEIVGAFKIDFPNLDDEAALNIARETVHAMIDENLIELYVCKPSSEVIEPAVSAERAIAIINDVKNWHVPQPGEKQFRLASTKRGDRAYFGE